MSFDAVRRRIGMGGDKLLPEVAPVDPDSPAGQAIAARRAVLFRERHLPGVTALPGARALVERLRAEGFALAVASSARKDELGPLLETAGVAGLFEAKTSADDAEESKPEPDIVVAARRRLGVDAPRAVLVGDTPYDREAARAAGVAFLGVRSGGWDDAALHGALAVYADAADLLARLADSPLAGGPHR